MFKAISLGVFCLADPSTRAIIRSTNVSPARAVIRTTISSDNTRVPPVTAERSPPDSRMTGADSPVMADSSTVAMPSTTSPSDGMISPAVTTTTSSRSRIAELTVSIEPSALRRRAVVSLRVLRSVSAWALPRPSATASAKLANNTVNQRKRATTPENTFSCVVLDPRSFRKRTVVSTLPIRTTNMTGFLACTRGCIFLRLSTIAERAISALNSCADSLPASSGGSSGVASVSTAVIGSDS